MQTTRIANRADVERIEAQPYAHFMPHSSVYEALVDVASRQPARTALRFVQAAESPERTRHWSYAEFLGQVTRAANLFSALTAPSQPRVALLLPAIPQAHWALWGAETAGVACPMNFALDASHLAELIQSTGANILVALGPHRQLDIWARAQALRERCSGLRHVLVVAGVDGAHAVNGLETVGRLDAMPQAGTPSAAQACHTLDFDQALAVQAHQALAIEHRPSSGAVAALFHTGGTTGAPKLAQHSHGNQLHAAWSAAQFYAMTERDVILNGFPLFHVAGSLVFGLSALLSGAEIVLPTTLGLRNAPMLQRYWQVVEQHGVSLLAAVPTVISMLLAVPPQGADLRCVRALLTGGSPLPPELAAAFEQRLGIPVRNILGMTESAGVVSIEPFHAERSAGSCGLRLPFTQVQAFDAHSGTACAPGQAGTLRLRGPNVSAGYTDPLRNAGTFSEDGWLISGDLGHVDEQGRIFVTGRAKDVIIRGAHNIDPSFIEDCLMQHPEVALAAAVGAPDEYAGELPVAFVVLRSQATANAATLLAFCQAHIAEAAACPKRIDVLQALPLTAIGKVYKPQLRRLATERVLGERLAAAGLTERVRCQGQDDSSGLSVVFTPAPSGHANQAECEVAVRSLMAPFAIRWRWTSD